MRAQHKKAAVFVSLISCMFWSNPQLHVSTLYLEQGERELQHGTSTKCGGSIYMSSVKVQ